MWRHILSPFPMAIGLWRVLCFREVEGCRVSIYCTPRGASQKTYCARWVWSAIEKRRNHTIWRPILLAISALLNLFFPKPCFIYKKTKTLREFGIRATRYTNYRVAVGLLVGQGNKSERVKRWKDNVKKEKIMTWNTANIFLLLYLFHLFTFYGSDLPCLIRTWEKLGRRPWSFYIWTICLVKPMDKNNTLCQYHLPIYPSID